MLPRPLSPLVVGPSFPWHLLRLKMGLGGRWVLSVTPLFRLRVSNHPTYFFPIACEERVGQGNRDLG